MHRFQAQKSFPNFKFGLQRKAYWWLCSESQLPSFFDMIHKSRLESDAAFLNLSKPLLLIGLEYFTQVSPGLNALTERHCTNLHFHYQAPFFWIIKCLFQPGVRQGYSRKIITQCPSFGCQCSISVYVKDFRPNLKWMLYKSCSSIKVFPSYSQCSRKTFLHLRKHEVLILPSVAKSDDQLELCTVTSSLAQADSMVNISHSI